MRADGGAHAFQSGVTHVADPIGTLYRKGRSLAVNDTACAPARQPAPRNVPNTFPAYSLDAKVAAEAGLDRQLLQVAGIDASVGANASVSFSIAQPRAQRLTDDDLGDVLRSASCVAAIREQMVIVRGYIIGQRKFVTTTTRTGTTKGGITKVGNVTLELSNAGLVTITDDTPQEFLQIVSDVTAPSPTTPNAAATVSAPSPVSGPGRIYIQQPRNDDPQKGSEVVRRLRVAGLRVEPNVERTANNLTPGKPQVRYFNESDRTDADRVLAIFRESYPEAELVRLKMQAPRGQLEVWLPRIP
jgi:hypothetical protein